MIKHFKNVTRRPSKSDWPKNPSDVPTLFSARKALRKLRVLVDVELIEVKASGGQLDKATVLLALLGSDVVEWYRYTDGLPPTDIQPVDLSPRQPLHPIYAGWAVAYPLEESNGYRYRPVVYSTKPEQSYTVGGVRGNMVELARNDKSQPVYTELDPEQQAEKREMDMLALQVADQAVNADLFITERPYLHSGSTFVSKAGVTACTLEEAIPLIALYLRAQREFVLPTGVTAGVPDFRFRFNRGLYYWVGARELLPEAWRWFSACVQHASGTGNDKLALLSGSLLSRVAKALQERDDVHIALNLPTNNDTSDEALGCLDNVLVSLMGAVDVAARVAHQVLTLSRGERSAGWQLEDWLKRVAARAPALAAVVDPGAPGEHTLTILRLLRNSVHGAALQGVTYFQDGKAETRIGLPGEEEVKILSAMDAMGGRGSWGVRSLGSGLSLVQPAVLVDRLFEEVVKLLNDLIRETPVESLPHVTITADNSRPPIDRPPRGNLDTFSEWNRLAIRWQLGF
ncbi:MAG: hypothetical protein OJF49_003247 [Ktedonobacterales bacterium]|nr:MAG: hypothetical protein OJF49_003247 [Ktedonobacterales bacterium]